MNNIVYESITDPVDGLTPISNNVHVDTVLATLLDLNVNLHKATDSDVAAQLQMHLATVSGESICNQVAFVMSTRNWCMNTHEFGYMCT